MRNDPFRDEPFWFVIKEVGKLAALVAGLFVFCVILLCL